MCNSSRIKIARNPRQFHSVLAFTRQLYSIYKVVVAFVLSFINHEMPHRQMRLLFSLKYPITIHILPRDCSNIKLSIHHNKVQDIIDNNRHATTKLMYCVRDVRHHDRVVCIGEKNCAWP